MRKKLIGLTLVLAIIMSLIYAIPTTSYAATSGTCGDNLTWTLEDGKLTISGYGDMTDWDSPFFTPWHEYKPYIYSVEILDGVTSIGSYSFIGYGNLTNIIIPGSVTSIGFRAFEQCHAMNGVYITDISAWCNIDFRSSYVSNPLSFANK